MVDELKDNQVFVFGSNIEGKHIGGAAKQAHDKFGAVWGIGVGLQGHSYAIPTMGNKEVMEYYCYQFLDYALRAPELEFLLTPIGTGIAGYSEDQIAPIFAKLPENVIKVGWND